MNWLGFFKNRKQGKRHETTRIVPDGMYRNATLLDADDDANFIRIVPTGRFPDHPDGDHEVTAEHIGEMVANFERTNTDILVDLDHDSMWGSTRAAGWIGSLEVRDDGLYAQYPVFTPFGQPFIESREFRYLSPVYQLNTRNNAGEPVGARLLSLALTNAPYMNEGEIDAIGNSDGATDEDQSNNQAQTMDREKLIQKLIQMLGLNDEATDEDIEAAIGALQQTQENSTDEGEGGADASGGSEESEASAGAAGGDGQADEADIQALVNSAVESRLRERGIPDPVEAMVDLAISNGKILPADRKLYIAGARFDLSGIKNRLDETKKNAALPGRINVSQGSRGGSSSSNSHLAGCRSGAAMKYVSGQS